MTGRDLTVPTILFLNCATSGLYREDLGPTDAGQPWVMACAFMLCNDAGAATNQGFHVIKADGRTAKENAVKVHGISAWATTQIGIPEPRFLGLLADLLKTLPLHAMKVVTYGDLDRRIISSLFARFGMSQGKEGAYARLWETRTGTEFVNLMQPWCQQVCRLPSQVEGEFKWPTLDEAAAVILGRAPVEGFRDAFADMLLVKDIYFELQRRGMFARMEAA
jgi:hypothetical protein